MHFHLGLYFNDNENKSDVADTFTPEFVYTNFI